MVSFSPMTSQLGQIPRSGEKDGRVSSRRSCSARSITAKTHILRSGALNSRFWPFNAPRSSNFFTLARVALVATMPSRLVRNRRRKHIHEKCIWRRPAYDAFGHASHLDRIYTGSAALFSRTDDAMNNEEQNDKSLGIGRYGSCFMQKGETSHVQI